MLSNSITDTRWNPLLFTVTQGGFSHNDQGNNFWIIVLQIWKVSCFQITDSKLWQTYRHYEILLTVPWEWATQSPGAAVRILEAGLCHGEVLASESGGRGAGSPLPLTRCAIFSESSDLPGPLGLIWPLKNSLSWLPSSPPALASVTRHLNCYNLQSLSHRLTQSSPQLILSVEETGAQR